MNKTKINGRKYSSGQKVQEEGRNEKKKKTLNEKREEGNKEKQGTKKGNNETE